MEWTESGITTIVDTADAAGQAALDLLAGEDFKGNSQAIMYGLSDRLNKPSSELHTFLSESANINDMVDVMVTIAAMKSAAGLANYTNPKTALLKLTTGVNVVQTAAQAAYLVHEFGQAAGAIFNDLLEISDQINALDDLDLCERSQAIQKIQDALVETMGTFLQEASPGVLKKVLGTVNLKKKKDNNNEECKSKPYNANNLKSCYENKGE